MSKTPARNVAGGAFLHPLFVGALLVLLLNDHVLKAAYPGTLTGKLSDIAGLTFFPAFLQASLEVLGRAVGRPVARSQRVLALSTLATAVVFTWVKLSPAGAELYRIGLGILAWPLHAIADLGAGHALEAPRRVVFVRDPSDLFALPAVLLGWGLETWRARRRALRARHARGASTPVGLLLLADFGFR